MTQIRTSPPVLSAPPRADAAVGVLLGGVAVAVVAVVDVEVAAVLAVPLLVAAVLAVIDQRTTRIATAHTGILAAVTLVAAAFGIALEGGSWSAVVAGAAVWAVPLFLLAVFGGFGGGDFKYAVSLGALAGWVSWSCALTGLLLALAVAGLAGVGAALRRRSSRAQIPLGLPLFIGAVLGVVLDAAITA